MAAQDAGNRALSLAGKLFAWIGSRRGGHVPHCRLLFRFRRTNDCLLYTSQVAVSLSVATWTASLPIAYRLYLPEIWANDSQLRQQAKIPNDIAFQTKLEIALGQIRQAIADGIPQGTVLADPAYGNDTGFRQAVAKLELSYVPVSYTHL